MPYLELFYYKRQGLPTFFNWKLVGAVQAWDNVPLKRDFLYRYKHLVETHPETKATVENFLFKPHVKLLDPEMIKEFLMRVDIYHKDRSFNGPL